MSNLANRSADFTSLVALPLATPFARDTRFLLQRSVPRLVWVWDLWDSPRQRLVECTPVLWEQQT